MCASPKNPATKSESGEASRLKWNTALDAVADAVVFEKAVCVPLSQSKASAGRTGKYYDQNPEASVINRWRRCHLNAQRIAELSRKAFIETGDYRKHEECRGCSAQMRR